MDSAREWADRWECRDRKVFIERKQGDGGENAAVRGKDEYGVARIDDRLLKK
jgi:hypothetical protein